jgi:hypothetical protein
MFFCACFVTRFIYENDHLLVTKRLFNAENHVAIECVMKYFLVGKKQPNVTLRNYIDVNQVHHDSTFVFIINRLIKQNKY